MFSLSNILSREIVKDMNLESSNVVPYRKGVLPEHDLMRISVDL